MPHLVRIEYWNPTDEVWYTGHSAYALVDPEKYISRLNARGEEIGRALGLGDDLQPTGQVWGNPDGTSFGPDIPEEEMDRQKLISLWENLDKKLDIIMSGNTVPDPSYYKNEARGFSEAIHILMSEHYPDIDAVVRESVTRYKARQANTPHESPGLGERPRRTGLAGTLRGGKPVGTKAASKPAGPAIKVKPKPAAFAWEDSKRQTALSMIEAGIFKTEEIATATGAPVSAVNELAASAGNN